MVIAVPTMYVPVVEMGEGGAAEELVTSSSTVFRFPTPSATKLPALKKCPEVLVPAIEKANCPCKEEVE